MVERDHDWVMRFYYELQGRLNWFNDATLNLVLKIKLELKEIFFVFYVFILILVGRGRKQLRAGCSYCLADCLKNTLVVLSY